MKNNFQNFSVNENRGEWVGRFTLLNVRQTRLAKIWHTIFSARAESRRACSSLLPLFQRAGRPFEFQINER
jgi:hypothetical protein